MPRTAIAQIAKLIGRELESGAGPSEQALATGPMLAEAGATTEIVERLLAAIRPFGPRASPIRQEPASTNSPFPKCSSAVQQVEAPPAG
jgi:hypothetical protein